MLTKPLGLNITKSMNELHPPLCHIVWEHGNEFFNYIVIFGNDCNQQFGVITRRKMEICDWSLQLANNIYK
jgi:hypothetical protein